MDKKVRLLILLTLVAAILLLTTSFITKSQSPSKKSLTQLNLDPKTKIEREIKTTFTKSSDKPIITYINLASEEKDLEKQYEYYKRAYSKMLASFEASKDAKLKEVINNFRNFLSTLKEFNAADLPLPK